MCEGVDFISLMLDSHLQGRGNSSDPGEGRVTKPIRKEYTMRHKGRGKGKRGHKRGSKRSK